MQISGTTVREYDFIALADGSFTIYTESSLDTYGELYYNGSRVASDDDDGKGNNFSITYSVTEGRTYTIKVRGYNSSSNGIATLFVEGNISSSDLTLTGGEIEEYLSAHAGEEITIRLLAQNETGRIFITDVSVKVYAMPEITFAHDYYYIVEGEDFETLFTVTDSFDETLEKTIMTTDDGSQHLVHQCRISDLSPQTTSTVILPETTFLENDICSPGKPGGPVMFIQSFELPRFLIVEGWRSICFPQRTQRPGNSMFFLGVHNSACINRFRLNDKSSP